VARFLLVLISISLFGCASYLKKQECEATNWFEHGQKVALRGEWLNNDQHVLECRQAEASFSESQLDLGFKSGREKYCDTDGAFHVGKSGDKFAKDLCEGPQLKSSLTAYSRGINEYCAKANAQLAGASGKKYLGVCSKEQEQDFLPGYRVGRKKYLAAVIDNNEREVENIERDVQEKNRDKSMQVMFASRTRSELSYLNGLRMNINAAADSAKAFDLDQRISTVESNLRTQERRIYELESSVKALEGKRENLQKETGQLRIEMASLD